MAIKTSISSMQIGDKIIAEYVASSGSVGTFKNLGTSTAAEIPLTASAAPNGSFYFIYVDDDHLGRKKLIADRNIQHTISWDTLNTAGVSSGSGLSRTIDGSGGYTVRLITTGVSGTDNNLEWDKYIVNSTLNSTITAGDNNVWHWQNVYTITSTTPSSGGSSNRVCRGYTSAGTSANTASNSAVSTNGFRPVLLVSTRRYLFKDGTDIKKFDGTAWSVIGTAPVTEAMFLNYGMTDVSNVNDSAIRQLTSPELEFYTGSASSSASISITGIPLINFKYKVTSDNPNQTLLMDYAASYSNQTVNDFVTLPQTFFTTSNPYTITVTALQEDNSILTNSGTVQLSDTQPTIAASVTTGNTFNLTVGDNENDQIKYLVTLNGTQIYPSTTGMTDFLTPPQSYTRTFKSNEIRINQQNTIHIEAQDQYGMTGTADLNFTGNYSGLMFSDEQGNFYSTDLGEVLKYLDFGSLVAGQTSDVKRVNIINQNSFSINNTQVWIQTVTPSGVVIELSTSNNPFSGSNSVSIPDLLASNASTSFYVRITTYPSAINGGTFDIYAKSNPA